MKKWDAVTVAISNQFLRKFVEEEFEYLRKAGLFSADALLIVEDPCKDLGSGGSALNALLITMEHLCCKRGYSVLTDSVFEETRTLILLMGSSTEMEPSGAFIFTNRYWNDEPDSIDIGDYMIPNIPLVHTIININKLAENTKNGVWISGTDSIFDLGPSPGLFSPSTSEISAFCFTGDRLLAESHGVYCCDEGKITDILYLDHHLTQERDSFAIILALLYLPPSIASSFLSFHSVYPISACTYYGTDSGTYGLKLSLFFDFILSTCYEKDTFLKARIGEGKIEKQTELSKSARQCIWQKFHGFTARAVPIIASEYLYLPSVELPFSVEPHPWRWSIIFKPSLERMINEILRHEPEKSIRKLLRSIALMNSFSSLSDTTSKLGLESMELFSNLPESRVSRWLATVANYLCILAENQGGAGLRSGPAANELFLDSFKKIAVGTEESIRDGIDMMFQITKMFFMDSPMKMIRAARHFEAAAQKLTKNSVMKMYKKWRPRKLNKPAQLSGVRVFVAGRVDLFGGWLDTPPITLQTDVSSVVNMAVLVDGQKPLSCFVEKSERDGIEIWSGSEKIYMQSAEEIWKSHSRPEEPGSLICACLVAAKVVKSPSDDLTGRLVEYFGSTGLKIECKSQLPHGSGLGTSSILAASILASMWRLADVQHDARTLVHTVLYVEQLLTTGGGWQDQIGGIYPGVKTGYMSNLLEGLEEVMVRPIHLDAKLEEEINQRLVLIYTGRTRLAKNLLQEVVRSWFSGGEVVQAIKSLQDNVKKFEDSLLRSEFPSDLVDVYYDAKKKLASGCEPEFVKQLIEDMKNALLCDTAWLAGAGGGGFLYVWLSAARGIDDVKKFLKSTNRTQMSAHSIRIDHNPIIYEEFSNKDSELSLGDSSSITESTNSSTSV